MCECHFLVIKCLSLLWFAAKRGAQWWVSAVAEAKPDFFFKKMEVFKKRIRKTGKCPKNNCARMTQKWVNTLGRDGSVQWLLCSEDPNEKWTPPCATHYTGPGLARGSCPATGRGRQMSGDFSTGPANEGWFFPTGRAEPAHRRWFFERAGPGWQREEWVF